MDHMQWIYLVVILTGAYGTTLFFVEIWRKRPAKATNVFKAVHLFMAGVTIIALVNFTGRYLWQQDIARIAQHWYWPLRWYPAAAALIYLNYHLTRKLMGKTKDP